MKLSARDAAAYFARPDPAGTGILIYGADTMRIATRRKQVSDALVGPQGEAEMRLTRIAAADLRRDPTLVTDAIRETGFFPGPRAVVVEDATDAAAPPIVAALADWRPGDAQLVVTAGSLRATSTLRKAFEGHRSAVATGLYDDPPGPQEVDAMLAAARLTEVTPDARAALTALSRNLDAGDFRQTVDKLGLYMHATTAPLSPEDVAACTPRSADAEVDDLLNVVADGRVGEIAGILSRLYAQGTQPVALCIGAMRHFRALHSAASDPGGAASGIGRARPPVFGARRDAMLRQCGTWGRDRLERAVVLLLDTDLQLRSSGAAPGNALVERALIRLAMMARRGT